MPIWAPETTEQEGAAREEVRKLNARSLPVVILDALPAVEVICDRLQEVVDSVSSVLSAYGNTRFHFVRHDPQRYPSMGELTEYAPAIWASLLAGTSCACEAASMTAVIIRELARRQDGPIPADGIRDVLNSALALHPFNVLVLKFSQQVDEQLAGLDLQTQTAREALVSTMDRYLLNRQKAVRSVVEQAEKWIAGADVVVIYGFSKDVLTLLTKTVDFRGQVIVVPVEQGDPLGKGEDHRVCGLLEEAGIAFTTESFMGLSSRLRTSSLRQGTIRFMVGARGVLANADVLSTAGNRAIAQVVRDFAEEPDAKVIVLAESDKRMENEAQERVIRDRIEESDQAASRKASNRSQSVSRGWDDSIDILVPNRHYDQLSPGERAPSTTLASREPVEPSLPPVTQIPTRMPDSAADESSKGPLPWDLVSAVAQGQCVLFAGDELSACADDVPSLRAFLERFARRAPHREASSLWKL